MMRHEREAYDAALDGAYVAPGSLCPWCGDDRGVGHGPCSEACELALWNEDRRREIADEIADELRGEAFDADAERSW